MRTLSCVIEGPPQPWQRVTRGADGHGYMPAKSRAYQRLIAGIMQLQRHQQPAWPIDARYLVGLRAVFATRHVRDLDNVVKAALDGLKKGGIYKDDAQVDGIEVRRAHDPARPRLELLIVALDGPIADTPLLQGLLAHDGHAASRQLHHAHPQPARVLRAGAALLPAPELPQQGADRHR